MNDTEYRCFLDLMMASDPWPLLANYGDVDEFTHGVLLALADNEAQSRGYESWIDAYHRFEPELIKE